MWLHGLEMKAITAAVLTGLVFLTAGCVGTVSGKRTGGVPFVRDRIEGRYERPANQVYEAAKEVLRLNGVLVAESTLHSSVSEGGIRTLEGRVNQRKVWISVEQIDPRVSAVTVQARTSGGGSDLYLCHELEKQIALRLASR
jgi:hypothetical protein